MKRFLEDALTRSLYHLKDYCQYVSLNKLNQNCEMYVTSFTVSSMVINELKLTLTTRKLNLLCLASYTSCLNVFHAGFTST